MLGDGRAAGGALFAGALPGDADGDGRFSVLDMRRICSHLGEGDRLVDADGDRVLSNADLVLLRDAVLGRASIVGVPTILPRDTWVAMSGVFPSADSIDVTLGGRSLRLGCLTSRSLSVFVPANQTQGPQALTVAVGGRSIATRTVTVQ